MLHEMLDRKIITPEFNNWLVDNNFLVAPASTKYHGAFEGGLYEHSCNVTRELLTFTDRLNLLWQREESPWIVGMFHDLCKIDNYRKVRTDVDEPSKMAWIYNDNVLIKGHGNKSVMLLSQFMTLTEEEIMCIRYHMGAYETNDWEQFDLAIKKYPNVLFTHTADMLASKLKV